MITKESSNATVLMTHRLVLRPVEYSDLKPLVDNLNDYRVSKWCGMVPFPYTNDAGREWIAVVQSQWNSSSRVAYSFGAELKDSGTIIGCCGLHDVNQACGTLGYWLGVQYHGVGLGKEMVDAVLNFAFNEIKLTTLLADAYVDNFPSARILHKAGFKQVSAQPTKKLCKADGLEKDSFSYRLTKLEYDQSVA